MPAYLAAVCYFSLSLLTINRLNLIKTVELKLFYTQFIVFHVLWLQSKEQLHKWLKAQKLSFYNDLEMMKTRVVHAIQCVIDFTAAAAAAATVRLSASWTESCSTIEQCHYCDQIDRLFVVDTLVPLDTGQVYTYSNSGHWTSRKLNWHQDHVSDAVVRRRRSLS